MKPFNLEEYLKDPSKKVVTRDGREARIICTDRNWGEFPIVALCHCVDDDGMSYEEINICTIDGKHSALTENEHDLFLLQKRKKVG